MTNHEKNLKNERIKKATPYLNVYFGEEKAASNSHIQEAVEKLARKTQISERNNMDRAVEEILLTKIYLNERINTVGNKISALMARDLVRLAGWVAT